MASSEMQYKVFEPVGSLGNDLVRGFIPKVVRGSELDHDRSLRSGHIRVTRCFCFSSTPQFDALLTQLFALTPTSSNFVHGTHPARIIESEMGEFIEFDSAFKNVDGICGQAGTWENEGNRTEGCKNRAVIWRMSSEQYYDRKRAANGIQKVVSRAGEQAAERGSIATGTDTANGAERGTDLRPEFEQQVQEQRDASTRRIGQAVDRRIALAVIPIEQVEQEESNRSAEYPRPLHIVFERNRVAQYVEKIYKRAAEERQSAEGCCGQRGANVARGGRALMGM
ncbi:hypothetical protein B0H14DRAFT_2636065 [Mycena olivaceomarginata]|nr:hypothetical protein B0H14DRAFT_2642750 [Mycena olivaceomarginata]KAJ7751338.1 hypothetical protein B0H14DRAFT_2636065 [Mycena olivaceomarginata]